MNKKVKIMEICDGIGGITQAFKRQDIPYEVVDYVEIEQGAVNIYNALNETNFEVQDITKWEKDIKIDLIFHKCPCTFELNEKEELMNSSLANTTLIANEYRPKYVFWELPLVRGREREDIFERYLRNMRFCGYTNYYKELNAKDYGIPQNRKRLYVVSILGKERFEFPMGVKLEKSYKDYLEHDYDVEQTVLSEQQEILITKYSTFPGRILEDDDIIYPEITSTYSKKDICGNIHCDEGYRKLSTREIFRLTGYDDEDFEKAYKVCNDHKELIRKIGEASAVNVLEAIINKIYK